MLIHDWNVTLSIFFVCHLAWQLLWNFNRTLRGYNRIVIKFIYVFFGRYPTKICLLCKALLGINGNSLIWGANHMSRGCPGLTGWPLLLCLDSFCSELVGIARFARMTFWPVLHDLQETGVSSILVRSGLALWSWLQEKFLARLARIPVFWYRYSGFWAGSCNQSWSSITFKCVYAALNFTWIPRSWKCQLLILDVLVSYSIGSSNNFFVQSNIFTRARSVA